MKTDNKRYILNLSIIFVIVMAIFMAISFGGAKNTASALDYDKPLDLFLEEYYGKKEYQEYKEDKKPTTYVTMIERAFNLVDPSAYALEFVFYKSKDDVWSTRPTVELKVDGSFVEYELEEQESLYDKFKRYKVKDNNNLLYKQAKQWHEAHKERVYEVSNATAITGNRMTVSGKYHFTGFMKGCAAESMETGTLKGVVQQIDVLNLDVHHYSYDNPGKSIGDGYHWKVYSVAFGIPEEYFKDGYKLTEIIAKYYEGLLKPVVSATHEKVYEYLKKYENVDSRDVPHNDSYTLAYNSAAMNLKHEWLVKKYIKVFGKEKPIKYLKIYGYYERFVWNPTRGIWKNKYEAENEQRKYIAAIKHDYNNGALTPTTKEELKEAIERKYGDIKRWEEYKDKIFTEDRLEYFKDPKGNSFNGWQTVKARAEDKSKALSFNDFIKSEDKGNFPYVYNRKLFNKVNKTIGIDEYKIIEELDDLKLKGNERELLVNKHELTELRAQYEENKKNGKRTFIYRFAIRNTFNTPVNFYHNDVEPIGYYKRLVGRENYVFQEKAFMDFKIIQMEFCNEKDVKIVPVGHKPIQILSGITEPSDPNPKHPKLPDINSIFGKDKLKSKKIKETLKKIGIISSSILGALMIGRAIFSIVMLIKVGLPAGKAYVKGKYGVDVDEIQNDMRKQKEKDRAYRERKKQQASERREKRKEMRKKRKIQEGSE